MVVEVDSSVLSEADVTAAAAGCRQEGRCRQVVRVVRVLVEKLGRLGLVRGFHGL